MIFLHVWNPVHWSASVLTGNGMGNCLTTRGCHVLTQVEALSFPLQQPFTQHWVISTQISTMEFNVMDRSNYFMALLELLCIEMNSIIFSVIEIGRGSNTYFPHCIYHYVVGCQWLINTVSTHTLKVKEIFTGKIGIVWSHSLSSGQVQSSLLCDSIMPCIITENKLLGLVNVFLAYTQPPG